MWETVLFRFFIVWYICGVILLSFDLLPPWLEWANVVFLVLAGTLGIVYFCKSYGRRGLIASFVIFTVSMFTEYLGTTYGLIFGKYIYAADFGLKIGGVPMTIGFAWLIVMSTSHALVKTIQPSAMIYVLYGSIVAVVMDLIIDPVAYVVKRYWIWEQPGPYYNIPLQNFGGWFFVAFLLHTFLVLYLKQKWHMEHTAWHRRIVIVFLCIMAMFLLLALIAQLYFAVALTTACTAIIIANYYWKRSVTS